MATTHETTIIKHLDQKSGDPALSSLSSTTSGSEPRSSSEASPGVGLATVLNQPQSRFSSSTTRSDYTECPTSLSSASSFQSLSGSPSLSSKASSGICADSPSPDSPDDHHDQQYKPRLPPGLASTSQNDSQTDYLNPEVPDLDDLIAACNNLNLHNNTTVAEESQPSDLEDLVLEDREAVSPTLPGTPRSHELSNDQTFTSATEEILGQEQQGVDEELQQHELNKFFTCANLLVPLPGNRSVIPYKSFEASVLNKQNGTEATEHEEHLVLSASNQRRSLTPCEEICIGQSPNSKKLPTTPRKEQQSTFNATAASVDPFKTTYFEQQDSTDLPSPPELPRCVVEQKPEILISSPRKIKPLDTTIELPTLNQRSPKLYTGPQVQDLHSAVSLSPQTPRIEENHIQDNNVLNTTVDLTPQNATFDRISPAKQPNLRTPVKIEVNFDEHGEHFIGNTGFANASDDNKLLSKEQKNFNNSLKNEELDPAEKLFNEINDSRSNSHDDADFFSVKQESCGDTNINEIFVTVAEKSNDLLQSSEEKTGGSQNLNDTLVFQTPRGESKYHFDKITNKQNLDETAILHDKSESNLVPIEIDYEAFKPVQQSTTLSRQDTCNFKDALSTIEASVENTEEKFVSVTEDIFDPSALDFLNKVGSKGTRTLRNDSLYLKFDPLANRLSMLPQKNSPPLNAEENEEKKIAKSEEVPNTNTPKRNPAIDLIDRLLLYSPSTIAAKNESPTVEDKAKKETPEKTPEPTVPFVDETMVKELESVKLEVLKLESELEKTKQEHDIKISQLQTQLAQEKQSREQMTVVIEEYEKSISRLIAEQEKDRAKFEDEKGKLSEELRQANQHLTNTEAAFSDVHLKYEKLKSVLSAYQSNETILKESIVENQETIKSLENRYETLKNHAMSELEKANMELKTIKKQNEAETIKLKALLRREELKSKSLQESVEQKMKENKELAQIIDEMIARN